MTPREVLTDASAGIITITINRPEARNAMNRAAAEAIASALDQGFSTSSWLNPHFAP